MSTSLKVSEISSPPVTSALRVEVASSANRFSRIAEAVALSMLFAFSLEAACRIEDWIQFRTPILAPERSQEDLLIRDALGVHGRPGGHFQKWSLNKFGMRGPEVAFIKPNEVIRVVTAGASETFGLYESPGHEYPRQLQDSLNAWFAGHDRRCVQRDVEVLNAAMPGMTLPTVDQDIRLRVGPLQPDFVVLYPTPAAYLDDVVPIAARPDRTVRSGPRLPVSNAFFPRVADRIRVQLKSLLPTALQDRIRRREINAVLLQHSANWRFESVPEDRLLKFDADLRHAVGTVRSVGAVPVLMTHANRFVGSSDRDEGTLRAWEKFYPRARGATIVAFDSVARLATMTVARDSQTVLVDLGKELAGSHQGTFADYSHFTDLGAALASRTIAKAILDWSAQHQKTSCEFVSSQ